MKVTSKLLNFKSANIKYADFIYDLRSKKGEYLNNVGFSEEGNKAWISKCPEREKKGKEYYFVISDNKQDVGVVRIYSINQEEKTFIWGSWILKEGTSPLYAVISAIMVYAFAFDYLNLETSILDVRNGNTKVKSFHEKSGAKFLRKDDIDTYYIFDKKDYINFRNNYDKYIGDINFEN